MVNVVFDGFGVEVFVDRVLGLGLVFEAAGQDSFEDNEGLSTNFPPGVGNEFLEDR